MVKIPIIGAGPAGIATALQLKRSGIEPLLLEKNKNRIGGLLVNALLVENYPGFPQGISGEELVKLFEAHLENAGIEVRFEEVIKLDHDGHFSIRTRQEVFSSQMVVLASGTKPKEFVCGVQDEAKNKIFYEIYPIKGVRDRRVVIVGAGDAAFDYALNLAKRNEVLILNRGEKLKCLPLLHQRAKGSPRIDYRENTVISRIESFRDELLLKCVTWGKKLTFRADYVIFAIGRVAQLDYLSSSLKERQLELEEKGLLYMVGDVKRGIYRQTAIAVGDGIKAAMKIYEKLR
jgi:thioredoxin reductase